MSSKFAACGALKVPVSSLTAVCDSIDTRRPEHTQNGTTNGQSHAYTGSFEEEDASCLEDTGEYEEEEPFQHEKHELFGAIEDEEEREEHYRLYCKRQDDLELGYG